MKKKYQAWGDFLKAKREKRFRSAREFCAKSDVGISYPQYSRYEAGEQLPHLEVALELCRLLEVPALEGLLEWNRAQVVETSYASIGTELGRLLERVRSGGSLVPDAPAAAQAPSGNGASKVTGTGVFTHASISLDDTIVFNRSHLKLFSADPVYRDIFTYVNSFAPEWIAAEEIAEGLRIPLPQMEEMLEKLSDLGVVLTAGGKCRATKRNFYFPDDPDFFPLRNLNLTHNINALMSKLKHSDLVQRRAYRSLVTRELTTEQLEQVIERIEMLMSEVVALPETKDPESIYSLCLVLGERFTRPAHLTASLPGLRRATTGEPAALTPASS